MPTQDKSCRKKYPQAKDGQVYHLIQGALFRALLKRDRFRGWSALTAAWASWVYQDLHPWLQDTFHTEESWLTYAYAVIDGRRPFPWPEAMMENDRLNESLRLVQQTIAWVAVSDPQRVSVVLGQYLPHTATKSDDGVSIPTTNDLHSEFARTSCEVGDVAHALCASLSDGHMDANEAANLMKECDEAIAEMGRLKDMAGAVIKAKGRKART